MTTLVALGLLICLSAPVTTVGQAYPSASELRRHPVASFDVQELNMIDALLQLGQEQQVPIGIEYIDAAAFRSQITLHAQNSTMGNLLDTVTHGRGYRWFIQNGVVMVTHPGEPRDRKNLLDMRIPEFAIDKEITLQAASLKLLGSLYWALNPHSTGIVGDYPSGNPKFRVGPLRMRNATVREILNRIVSQRRNGAWVVQQPRGGIWIKTRHTDYGESSNMTGTTVRNTASCFRSGGWDCMILSSGTAPYPKCSERSFLLSCR